MAKKKIQEYKFYPGIGIDESHYPNATALLKANKTFIQKEVQLGLLDRYNLMLLDLLAILTMDLNVNEIQDTM